MYRLLHFTLLNKSLQTQRALCKAQSYAYAFKNVGFTSPSPPLFGLFMHDCLCCLIISRVGIAEIWVAEVYS